MSEAREERAAAEARSESATQRLDELRRRVRDELQVTTDELEERAEIRADFFNATNTPHYANPNGSFGNANFGRVTGIIAQTERMIRFGARFLF